MTFNDRPFAALNTALFEDGAFVTIADGRVIEQPIQIVFLSTVTGVARRRPTRARCWSPGATAR